MKTIIKFIITAIICSSVAFTAYGNSSSNGTDRTLMIYNDTNKNIYFKAAAIKCMYIHSDEEKDYIPAGEFGTFKFEEEASGYCAMRDKSLYVGLYTENNTVETKAQLGGLTIKAYYKAIGANIRNWLPKENMKFDRYPGHNNASYYVSVSGHIKNYGDLDPVDQVRWATKLPPIPPFNKSNVENSNPDTILKFIENQIKA